MSPLVDFREKIKQESEKQSGEGKKNFFTVFAFNLMSHVIDAFQAMTLKVDIANHQKFPDSLKVSNLDQSKIISEFTAAATGLKESIDKLHESVTAIKIPEQKPVTGEVKVSDLDKLISRKEFKLPNRVDIKHGREMAQRLKAISKILGKKDESVVIDNVGDFNFPQLFTDTEKLQLLEAIQHLRVLSQDPDRPLAVRLTDGREFYEAIASAISGGFLAAPSFVNESGPARQGVDRLAEFRVADIDEQSVSPRYYGFLDTSGKWYIMKEVNTAELKTYTYIHSVSDYSTNWTGRAALSYQSFSDEF